MEQYFKNNIQMLKYIHKASRFRIVVTLFNAMLQSILPVWNIIIIQKSISLLTNKQNAFAELLTFVLLSIIMYLFIILFDAWYRQNYSVHSNFKIREKIQTIIYEKIRNIDMSAFDNKEFYTIYTRAVKETYDRALSVLSTTASLLTSILSLVGVISIVLWLDAIILVFVFVSVILSMFISAVQNKSYYCYDMEQTYNTREQSYISRIFYLPEYSKEIKFFDLYGYFINKFKRILYVQDSLRRKFDFKFLVYDFIQNFSQIILVFSIIIYLGWRYSFGAIVIADFASLLNASQELGNSLQRVFALIPEFAKNSFYIDNINEFLQYSSVIEDDTKGIELQEPIYTIELQKINFKYPGNNVNALDGINLQIQKGEKIAIVGLNGSGKTTLIKMLLRLYDPTSGEIYLNNVNYKNYNVYSLRKKIGVVFQDFQIYATTIADNVLLRSVETESDIEIVIEALKHSGLYDKVASLKKGIFTFLSREFDENGITFSGGELQKLALSRVYASNYDIIVMDEPSSALDPIAEYEFNQSVLSFGKERTIIIVSHRLSTTKDVDKIVFMEAGKIIEIGTHETLMELNGKYAHMFKIQSEKYNN